MDEEDEMLLIWIEGIDASLGRIADSFDSLLDKIQEEDDLG